MKILAITQARIGSTRLPEKILKTINEESLLEIHLKRIQRSKLISKLKIATTTEPEAEKIVAIGKKVGIEVYKGSIDNVLERFYNTAAPEKPDWVVRFTSDCPLIDAEEIDKVIQFAIDHDLDYVSNILKPTLPDGLDTEVFKFTALERALKEATLKSETEHVTPYIWKNSTFMGGNLFKSDCVMSEVDYSKYRLTVDTAEDFVVIKGLVEMLGSERSWIEYVHALDEHPEIKNINEHFTRNEGYEKSINSDNI